MPPIKVLWTVKQLNRGGTETLLVNTAPYFDPAEVKISVVYTMKGQGALASALSAYADVRGLEASALLGPGWVLKLRHVIQSEQAQVVHSHSPVTAIFSRLACATVRPRPALVCTQHGAWRSYRAPTRAAERATAALDDAQLAVSDAVRRSLPPAMARRASVMVHGVDLRSLDLARQRRPELRQNLGVEAALRPVVSVANLHGLKDHETLLRAARTVVAHKPDVIFWLAGDGPRRNELERLSAQLGLEAHVRFLGDRPDALELVAAADLFVLSSFSEGLPISVVEAMALGVPVIATNVGGVPEAVTDGVEGFLVPPRSPELMAEAILRVLNDTSLWSELSTAALRRRADFDAEITARRLTDLYRDLAQRYS